MQPAPTSGAFSLRPHASPPRPFNHPDVPRGRLVVHHVLNLRSITMKAFFIKTGEKIVQTVRDYPKGTLIAWGVTLILAKVF